MDAPREPAASSRFVGFRGHPRCAAGSRSRCRISTTCAGAAGYPRAPYTDQDAPHRHRDRQASSSAVGRPTATSDIPQRYAMQINAFCAVYLNPLPGFKVLWA